MIRRSLLALAALAGLLAFSVPIGGCTTASEDVVPRAAAPATTTPPPARPVPPHLTELNVPNWPPFGPSSRISAQCSDDVGVRRISAQFKQTAQMSVSGTSGETSFSGSDLGEGQGTLYITCCDVNGACAERQITNFLVDLSPPEIVGDRLVASPLEAGLDGEISIWVRDAWVLGSVELTYAGKTFTHELPKAYPSTLGKDWDVTRIGFPAKDFPIGNGKATVIARDAAGNTTTKDLALRIDATPPTASILSPSPGVVGDSFLVRVEASDDSNPVQPSIDLWVGGTRVAELAGPLAEITVDTQTLPPGPTEVRAIARDDAGNESTVAKVIVQVQ
jgi:hypothetical protein